MLTPDEFRRLTQLAHLSRQSGKQLQADADRLEDFAVRLAGVTHTDREPGFPAWQIEGVPGYFNTPEQAIEAANQPPPAKPPE